MFAADELQLKGLERGPVTSWWDRRQSGQRPGHGLSPCVCSRLGVRGCVVALRVILGTAGRVPLTVSDLVSQTPCGRGLRAGALDEVSGLSAGPGSRAGSLRGRFSGIRHMPTWSTCEQVCTALSECGLKAGKTRMQSAQVRPGSRTWTSSRPSGGARRAAPLWSPPQKSLEPHLGPREPRQLTSAGIFSSEFSSTK